jgi:DNA-binding NarL/FixJ family response regulator
VLTLWDNLRYVQAISKMDVDAMMHKSSSAEDLLATFESVTRDGSNAVVVMPRALLQRLDNAPSGGLSERKIEVLVLAARGLSNRGIAEELHLAEATIKRHLANVYGKVGVRSRNEAVRKALLEDWIGLHEITSADGDVSSDEQAG